MHPSMILASSKQPPAVLQMRAALVLPRENKSQRTFSLRHSCRSKETFRQVHEQSLLRPTDQNHMP